MGSNPIIGTSENAFYHGKFANTASSIDSAGSRIKTYGLLVYLPSSSKCNSSEHAVALHGIYYNFCRNHQTLEVIPVIEAELTDHIRDLEKIITLLEPSAV
ncbi:MAG: hypothetical protein DMF25_01650 [Verrucomicrobia bacterium]|nr:MAG: hypothetical protein DMF25_01650 [Verrucomicrobiota bacterium]